LSLKSHYKDLGKDDLLQKLMNDKGVKGGDVSLNTYLTCRNNVNQNQTQPYAVTPSFAKPQTTWESC